MQKKISYVIPCYRSEKTIESVINEIEETMSFLQNYTYEIVLVNDGSPDNTWGKICEIVKSHKEVKGFNFAKNFGQHAALMAGLNNVTGDIIICLDDDGQTPANEATKLIRAIEDGADAVYAKYDSKKHSAFRNFGTAMNEWMTEVMLGKPKKLYVSSYFAVRRFVVDEMVKYKGSYPYVIGLVLRTTKNIVNVDVNHRSREIGTSGYNFAKLLGLWVNGFTAFSIKPLRIATVMGCVFAFIGFIYGIYTIIKRFVLPDIPAGFSALMAAIIFFGGMTMLMLGMAGEYIGRTYISINDNPQYVVRDVVSSDAED
ncbi:glycosyltransferase family 2 protein [Butyrivibrio sp.]|uniref:glycosyltransferase family 2 protein n=1 Tax=Butyrivibrio sp. TaxID=28121 RepID=UPI0025C26138|nr:glycosyltransferase family 2 protein [Butyrivibrio sp.]MBQ9302775.1 glycosyltransferase family 2 protein [Butyrivibrio sp.]